MKKPIKENTNYNIDKIVILGALILVFIFLYLVPGIYYGMNDDIGMQKIISGSRTGEPDGHALFIRCILGYTLATMYKIIPQLDWYGIFMVGSVFVCSFIILVRVFSLTKDSSNKWLIRILSGLSVLFIILDTVVKFQFTLTAGMWAATAVFCVVSSKKLSIKDFILAVVFLLIASLIRNKVMYMSAPIVALAVFWRYIVYIRDSEETKPKKFSDWVDRVKKQKVFLIKIMGIALVAAILWVSFKYVDNIAYSKGVWKEFSEYKHYRSLIMDYYKWPEYDSNIGFWYSQGVTREEYECLDMYGVLPNFDIQKIIAIGKYVEENPDFENIHNSEYVINKILEVVTYKKCIPANVFLALSVIALVVFAIKSDRFMKIRVALGMAVYIAMLAYLIGVGRIPDRIVLIYDYQCILAIWGTILSQSNIDDKKISKVFTACSAAIVAVLGVFFVVNTANDAILRKQAVRVYNQKAEYIKQYEDSFIVVTTGTVKTAKQFTLLKKDTDIPNTMSTYGWSIYSPWSESKLEEFGINREDNILLDPSVYMLTNSLPTADKLSRYYFSMGWIDETYTILDENLYDDDDRIVYLIKWNPSNN